MDTARRVTVVVLFAEALAAPEVAWSLVDAGFTVVGVKRRGARAALAHSHLVTLHEVTAPEADAQAAQRELAQLLARLTPPGEAQQVLLPLDDAAVWLCSRTAPTLPPPWLLAGPSTADQVALALDKRAQVAAASQAGLEVPPTVVASAAADFDRLPFGFPLILRPALPAHDRGGRLVKGRNWICSDRRELWSALDAWGGREQLLVQPYLYGIGEGVFGLAAPHGVVGWSAHRRLRMMNPHGSGSSACVSRGVDEALKAPIARLVEAAAWRGIFMVELLRDPAGGTPRFVEFNGRAWGSMALARRQGFEYPAWAVEQALGREIGGNAIPAIREGVVCRNLGRELMHLLFVLRGRRSRAVREWPSFWSALRDVVRPHRGGQFYNWRSNDWRVFAGDCWYTVSRNAFKARRS